MIAREINASKFLRFSIFGAILYYILSSLLFFTGDISFRDLIVVSVIGLSVIVCAFVYWYLILRPVRVYDQYSDREDELSRAKQKVFLILEIEKSLKLYDPYLSPDDKKYLVEYIRNRTEMIFSYRDYYRKINFSVEVTKLFQNDCHDFNVDILENEIALNLFKNQLDTYKIELEDFIKKFDEIDSIDVSKKRENEASFESLQNLISILTIRLKSEIAQLSKRSDVYIFFGSTLTLVSGVILYFVISDYFHIKSEVSYNSVDYFTLFVRFSIVVFVEIFAFYYLRLYRNIMQNIKFYQNEISNIEMKVLSYHAACGDKDLLKLIVDSLSKTERNFVIDKNKTTVDLERSKLEAGFHDSLIKGLNDIIKNVKSG